jgi:hypothetical protein
MGGMDVGRAVAARRDAVAHVRAAPFPVSSPVSIPDT